MLEIRFVKCRNRFCLRVFLLLSILPFMANNSLAQNTVGSATGRVQDPDCKGIAGAKVQFRYLLNGSKNTWPTNQRGDFTTPLIPNGTYALHVFGTKYRDEDHDSFEVLLGPPSIVPEPVFTLNLAKVVGTVVDENKAGVGDVKVVITEIGAIPTCLREVINKPTNFTKTDSNGNFKISFLPASTYSITFTKDNVTPITKRFEIKSKDIWIAPQSLGVIKLSTTSAVRNVSIDDNEPSVIGNDNKYRAGQDEDAGSRVARVSVKAGFFVAPESATGLSADQQGKPMPAQKQPLADDSEPEITTVQLKGRVVDATGKGLIGVDVLFRHVEFKNEYLAQTDDAGAYALDYLPTGTYSVTVSKPGFRTQITKQEVKAGKENEGPNISLNVGKDEPRTANAEREAGQFFNIELPEPVRKYDAGRGANFGERYISSLPLGATTAMRGFDEMALLVPGVAPAPYTPGIRGPGVGFAIGTAGEFSVNGMRSRSNNFSIDGSDNNDPDVGVRRQGFINLGPQSVESVQDFSISTLLWSSELGPNFGSQVNAVTKSGSNVFHGQAYLFLTDSRFNARNAFDFTGGVSGDKDPFTRIQTGLALGGPIRRDHEQFFASLEHQEINNSIEQHFSTPAASQRNFRGLSRYIVSPGGESGRDFSSFGVPSGVTPLGSRILSLYPLPNNPAGPYGNNTYTEVLPADGEGTILSFRLTEKIRPLFSVLPPAGLLNVRLNSLNDNRVLPSINRAIRSTIRSKTTGQDISIILDQQIAKASFQTRLSFGRTRLTFSAYPTSPLLFSRASSEKIETTAGLREVEADTGMIGELNIEPFSPVGVSASFFPQRRVSDTFQFAETVSIPKSDHLLKYGANIRRKHLDSTQDRFYRPLVSFTSGIVRIPDPENPNRSRAFQVGDIFSGVESAALGVPSSVLQTITIGTPDSTIGLRFTEFAFFFNDTWRVTSNLTIDYGIRYEYSTVPGEVNSRIEDVFTKKSFPPVPNPEGGAKEIIASYDRILAGRTQIYDPDGNNFGPRIGFAWVPWADRKTAIRGGYGIYYDAILGAVVNQSRNIFPIETEVNLTPDVYRTRNDFIRLVNLSAVSAHVKGALFVPLIANGTLNQFGGAPQDFFPFLFTRSPLNGAAEAAFTLPDKNLRAPYAQHWHLTLERQILSYYTISLAYVGTRGVKLTRITAPNGGSTVTTDLPFTTSQNVPSVSLGDTGISRRPVPTLGAYQIIENSASSNYHALQLEVRKQYKTSLGITAAYTWSHAIDDVSDIFTIEGAPILAQNQQNQKLERGNASFDLRHRFAASLLWDVPFFQRANGLVATVLKGWQAAAIFQSQTGQPFTLNLSIDANEDGNLTDRPDTTAGMRFFSGHGGQKISIEGHRESDFFSFGHNGQVGRNTLRGDGFSSLDVSLRKSLKMGDKYDLYLRAEAFNLLNRANFGLPIRTIGAPGFGSSVDVVGPARIIQFALKVSF